MSTTSLVDDSFSSVRWGRLIATPHFLPSNAQKPSTASIPVHSVQRGRGALSVDPSKLLLRDLEKGDSNDGTPPAFSLRSVPGDTSSRIQLDVCLFPTISMEEQPKDDPVASFMLDRDARENVAQTLKRIFLRVCRTTSEAKKRKPGTPRKPPFDMTNPLPIVVMEYCNESLLENGSVHQKHMSPVDVSSMSMADLCRQAISKRLCVKMDLPPEGSSDHSSYSEAPTKSCILVVESYPPTVSSVQTYQDFKACLFPNVPIVVQVDVLYATNCRVEWFIDGDLAASTYGNGKLHSFTPQERHIDGKLEIIVTPVRRTCQSITDDLFLVPHSGQGRELAFRFAKTVSCRPLNSILEMRRPWLDPAASTNNDGNTIRVISYNILADQNAFSRTDKFESAYPYCSVDILHKERRLPLVVHEILEYRPHIICLQEVDEFAFESLLLPTLQSENYQGYFSLKQSDGTREGCALFFSLDVFNVVSEGQMETIVIRDILESLMAEESGFNTDEESFRRVLDLLDARPDVKDVLLETLGHVVQVVPLRYISPPANAKDPPILWVANTHLFFHPKASHFRLLQSFLFSCLMSQRECGHLIMAGDFNAALYEPPLQLLVEGHVAANARSTREHLNTFRWDVEKVDMLPDRDMPPLTLFESFPSLVSAVSPEPEFTHYLEGFSKSLDHILISRSLECKRYAPFPTLKLVTKHTAMPSAEIPSDHVCLVCDISWKE